MHKDVANLEELTPVDENSPRDGTAAIAKIRDRHGADLDLRMGKETGEGGIWINFYVRGQLLAAFDYFAGVKSEIGPGEGATIYVHPDYL